MRKNLSDLANYIKKLKTKIQMLQQQCVSSSIPRIEKQFRIQLLEKVDIFLPDELLQELERKLYLVKSRSD